MTRSCCARPWMAAMFALCGAVAQANPAYALPKVEDAKARALLERTAMSAPRLEALWKFQRPPAQPWPCEEPKALLYMAAGLLDAIALDELPQAQRKQREDLERMMRKMYRDMGIDPAAAKKDVYSNITLIPIKAQCVGARLEGEVEYYVAYDKASESVTEMFSATSQKMEKTFTSTQISSEVLMRLTIADNSLGPETTMVQRGQTTMKMRYENPEMQRAHEKIAQRGGMEKPQDTFNAVFTWPDGQVMFTPSPSVEMSAGFLAPNVKATTKLMTSITLVNDKYRDSTMYMGADLLGTGRMNVQTQNALNVSYTPNFAKALGKKIGEIPGMGEMKEVVINGKDMLESRTCMVNLKPAKVEPCPVD